MLHAGANAATLEEVEAVATPDASAGWTPIPHATLLATVVDELTASGLRVTDQSLALWNGLDKRASARVDDRRPAIAGARFFAVLALRNGEAHDDYQLIVGLRNSHDQSSAAGLALGSRVFVCDNMAFSGEVTFSRKHTSNILRDLPGIANRAVAKLNDLRGFQTKRIDAYKAREISAGEVHDFVIRTIDADVLKVTRLHDVLREWRTPKHDEFAPRNLWSLFNAYTEVFKGSLPQLTKRTLTLHGLCDTLVGLEVPVANVVEEN